MSAQGTAPDEAPAQSGMGAEAVLSGPEAEAMADIVPSLVELMRASHPLLQSYRAVLEAAEAVPTPRGGINELELGSSLGTTLQSGGSGLEAGSGQIGLSLGVTVPLGQGADEVAQRRLEVAVSREEARQELERLQASLTQELLGKVQEVAQAVHRLQSRQELLQALIARRASLERLLEAGALPTGDGWRMSDLWDLDERIADLQAELRDLRSRRVLVIRETAENYGGDAAQEMIRLLEQVR